MHNDVTDLFKDYALDGWTIHDAGSAATTANPLSLMAEDTNRLVRVPRHIDLSPRELRELLGVSLKTKIVSLHSGVNGGQNLGELSFELSRCLTQHGISVANGGYPSRAGGMHSVVDGFLAASSKDRSSSPFIIVATETLFLKDNLKSRYPRGNMRVLVIEDSAHGPDTIQRGHTLNAISDHVVTLPGGSGTTAENAHMLEMKERHPELYAQGLTIVNSEHFYRDYARYCATMAKGFVPHLNGVNFYTPLWRATSAQIAHDLAEHVRSSISRQFTTEPLHGILTPLGKRTPGALRRLGLPHFCR